jgi:hypothetical protein
MDCAEGSIYPTTGSLTATPHCGRAQVDKQWGFQGAAPSTTDLEWKLTFFSPNNVQTAVVETLLDRALQVWHLVVKASGRQRRDIGSFQFQFNEE